MKSSLVGSQNIMKKLKYGGAGNLNHIKEVFQNSCVDAVACGSMFVYQGPLKGVLISYPSYQKIQELL